MSDIIVDGATPEKGVEEGARVVEKETARVEGAVTEVSGPKVVSIEDLVDLVAISEEDT